MAYVALLEASVLHPWIVCDILLRLAERGTELAARLTLRLERRTR